jgi:tripartite-type tricarboxylate transporter receptor subunit TctC
MKTLRWTVAATTALPLMLAAGHAAAAQGQFPERPVRLLVGFGAGGGTDVSARLIAKFLTESWGKSVLVENKPGADGDIATVEIARAKPDGYNLLVTTTSIAITPAQRKVGFDPYTSFEPITLIGSSPSLVVVHPSMPVKTIKQLVALAKSKPGAITFGSAGAGTVPYLATELFLQETGTRMVHVPYKGGGPAVIGILSGETQLLFNSTAPLRPHVVAGKLRPIGVTSPKRLALYPDVPTLIESGLPGFDTKVWFAAFAPAQTPKDIVHKLNEEFVKAIRSNDVRGVLEKQGNTVEGSTADELARLVRTDFERWSRVIKNIKN